MELARGCGSYFTVSRGQIFDLPARQSACSGPKWALRSVFFLHRTSEGPGPLSSSTFVGRMFRPLPTRTQTRTHDVQDSRCQFDCPCGRRFG
jgi:hypothetical protein